MGRKIVVERDSGIYLRVSSMLQASMRSLCNETVIKEPKSHLLYATNIRTFYL